MRHSGYNESMQLPELIRQFLEHLEVEKNRAVKTAENYDRYLRRFLRQTGAKKPGDITDELVRQFRLKLARTSDNGKSLRKQTQFKRVKGTEKEEEEKEPRPN